MVSSRLSYLVWVIILILGTSQSTQAQNCEFRETTTPTQVFITAPEESQPGSVVYTFVVDPIGSTIEWDCPPNPKEPELDPCYYLEVDGSNLVYTNFFNLESGDFFSFVTVLGDTIYYIPESQHRFTCYAPGTSPDDGSSIESQIQFQNVNEAANVSAVYNAKVLEHSPADTIIYFDFPIIAADPDIIVEGLDYGSFNCTLLNEEAIPFNVSCVTTNNDGIKRASVEATITVDGLLDYESDDNTYDIILYVTDTTDDGVNSPITVNTTLHIEVTDTDDLNPAFNSSIYQASVNETYTGPIPVTPQVAAYDQDLGAPEPIVYSLYDETEYLMIDTDTGDVSVTKLFDREAVGDEYTVDIVARQKINTGRFATAKLTITINDINDNCPGFDQSEYTGQVSEDDYYVSQNGIGRLTIIATDPDQMFEGAAELQQDNSVFGLVPSPVPDDSYLELYIVLFEPQNLGESGTVHELQVVVSSEEISGCSNSTTIMVEVVDINPVFVEKNYVGYINETAPVGTEVLTVNATNSDGNNEGISYRIKSATDNGQNVFKLNETTGVITVQNGNTDADDGPIVYTLVVEAIDRRKDPTRFTSTPVTIYINDINDNCPVFSDEPSVYYGEISSQDVYVVDLTRSGRLMLTAEDPDQEYIAETIETDGSGAGFEVEQALSPDNRIVYYITVKDFSQLMIGESYNIQVSLTDPSQGSCSVSMASVNITAVDLSPVFEQVEYRAAIDENSFGGTSVANVSAITYDGLEDAVMYSLRSSSPYEGAFQINDLSGVITVQDGAVIDAENATLYTLFVEAQDRRFDPIRSATATVFVEIMDLNDNCPGFTIKSLTGQVSSQDVFVVTTDNERLVLEARDSDIGDFIGKPTVTDDGGTDAGFVVELAPSSGGNKEDYYIKVSDFSKLQLDATYTIEVSLMDPSPGSSCSVSMVSVNITAVDLSPVFDQVEYRAAIDENSLGGTSVVNVSAITYDGMEGDVFYSLRSSSPYEGAFQLNDLSGEITVQDGAVIDAEIATLYTLFVEAQDRRFDPIRSATATMFVEIMDLNDNCPGFTMESLTGQVSSQDVFVVTSDNERLVLEARDSDIGDFIGEPTVTDDGGTDAGFEVEIAPSSGGNKEDYYIKVSDFSKLELDMTYTIQVSLTDPSQGSCSVSMVSVNITAIDLSPVFDQVEYRAAIYENSLGGTSVANVSASTYDGLKDAVIYSLRSSSPYEGAFQINDLSGEITVQDGAVIDAENATLYTLFVEAQDRRFDPIRSATATVFVDIMDLNDNCPGFTMPSLTGQVSSQDVFVVTIDNERLVLEARDSDIGDFIGDASVTDDGGTDAGFGVEIAPSSGGNKEDYYIKVSDFSKLELDATYTIQVSLTDPSHGSCSVSMVSVNITAIDLSPVFDQVEYRAAIDENSLGGTSVANVSASTYDGLKDAVIYSLRSSSPYEGAFQINDLSGEITVQDGAVIDAENATLYTLFVEAQDRRFDPIRSATATVFVEIMDLNDKCPEFAMQSLTGQVSSQDVFVVTIDNERLVLEARDSDIGDFIGKPTVTDDGGTDAGFDVEIAPSSGGNKEDYYIKVSDFSKLQLDATYTIEVSLTDPSQGSCSVSMVSVNITAIDLSPVFDQVEYRAAIDENSLGGTLVANVSASTYDGLEDAVIYSLRSSSPYEGAFEINELSGEITVQDGAVIDAENATLYTLVVEAQDRRFDPIRSTTATVFVEIMDLNDKCPEFTMQSLTGQVSSQDVFVVTIDNERLVLEARDSDIGDFIGDASVTDDGGTDAGFGVEIAPSSGGNKEDYYIKVSDFSKLELDVTYTIQVSLTDPSHGSCSVSMVSVNITAIDLSPVFDQVEYRAAIDENSLGGTLVANVSASTYDSEDAVIYSLRSSSPYEGAFQINDLSGEITVQDGAVIDAENATLYTLVVEAQDKRYDLIRSATATVFVEIMDLNDNCPGFTMPSLTGQVSSQDVFVVTIDNERLVLEARDSDIGEFSGKATVTDYGGTDAGFEVEIAPSSGGNKEDYYIKVSDFSKLELDATYTIQVSLIDPLDVDCSNTISVNITAVDLSPVFDQVEYRAAIDENSLGGTSVANVSASTYDSEDAVIYSLRSSSPYEGTFQINDLSGEITVQDGAVIDAENATLYTLVVEAQDRRFDPIRSSTTSVFVSITDVNDECPSFTQTSYHGNVTRQDVYVVDQNLEQLMVIAVDPDSKFDGVAILVSDNPSFELVDTTPQSEVNSLYLSIKLTTPTGIQDGATYNLQITVNDSACSSSIIADVIVTVSDSLAPVFNPVEYQASILEGASIGDNVAQVYAYRPDNSFDEIYYRLQSANNGGAAFFSVSSSGLITVKSNQTNAELVTEYTLVIEAEDRLANPVRSATTTVTIQIVNTNDNCPVFEMASYSGIITPQDKYVVLGTDNLERLILEPTDDDIMGFNGTVDLLTSDGIFGLEQAYNTDGTNVLVYIVLLDPTRLNMDNYTIQVSVTDDTTIPSITCKPSITNVSIHVVQDLAPEFTQDFYTGRINESTPIETPVAMVTAISRNSAPSFIFYKLTKGDDLFQINQTSGQITVKADDIDYEMTPEHTLVVEAQDRAVEPFRSASVNVIVSVNDINDNCPSFASHSDIGQATLDERFVLKYGTVDRFYLTAVDNDIVFEGVSMVYNDTSGNSFGIVEEISQDTSSLQVFVEVTDPSGLEVGQSYQLGILLTDSLVDVDCSSYAMVTILVEDLSPKFTQQIYRESINETVGAGTPVAMVNATNKDGNSDGIVYLIKSVTNGGSDKFEIDPESGEITVSNTLSAEEAQEYTVFVEARDTRTEIIRTASASVIVTIEDVNNKCPEFSILSYEGVLSSQDAFVVTVDYEERLLLEAIDTDVDGFIGDASVSQSDPGAGFQVVEVANGGVQTMGYYIKVDEFAALDVGETYTIQITLEDVGNTYCDTPSVANVTITVRDLAPVFTQPAYYANITEEALIGTFVEQVSANNSDSNSQGITYTITSSTPADGVDVFTIEADSGVILVQDTNTDREEIDEYVLVVEAQDRRLDPIRSSTVNVFVRIDDINDKCPEFISLDARFGQITRQDVYVVSNRTQEILVLRAQDGDLMFAGEPVIMSGNTDEVFILEDSTPPSEVDWLYLSIRLDKPDLLIDANRYELEISITDTDLVCSSVVDVIIMSADSLAPTFKQSDYRESIKEGTQPGTDVVQVKAFRQNSPDDDEKIFYRLQSASSNGDTVFAMNATTGMISVVSDQTDVEDITTEYVLVVEAEDRLTNPTRIASTSVVIKVNNTNDECPGFAQATYTGVVTTQDRYVVNGATDLNRLVVIPVDYDIAGFDGYVSLVEDSSGLFSIEQEEFSSDGSLMMVYFVLNEPTDPGNHTLELLVSDNTTVAGVDCSDDFTTITVTVLDVEDLAPIFTQRGYNASIPENSLPNAYVTEVIAESQNPDSKPGDIYYQLTLGNDMFDIDQNGVITVASDKTNYELVKEYFVIVEAQDRGIEPFRSTSTSLIVYITDENDECPDFVSDQYAGQISVEDTYVFEDGKTNRLTLAAKDLDSTFEGTPSIISGNTGNSFSLEETTSPDETTMYWYITLNTTNSVGDGLPYELQISVLDKDISTCSGGSNTTVIIQVENLSPRFTNDTYYGQVSELDVVGTPVVKVNATDKDGSQDGIVYSLKSASDNGVEVFEINAKSGEITIKDLGLDADSIPKYTLFIEAQDTKLEVPRLATATVVVQVINENDICPVFVESAYTGSLGLGDEYVIGNGGSRLVITAIDMDMDFVGDVDLLTDTAFDIEISSSADPALKEYFIVVKNASLITPGVEYFLQMSVTNTNVWIGCPPELTNVTVSVSETLAPSFDHPTYYGNITENELGRVIQVQATRPDDTSVGLIYKIKSSTADKPTFTIDAETGIISATGGIDYESVEEYLLFVEAEDRSSEPFRSAGATVTVTVIDINDVCPYFEMTSYSGQITPGDVYVRMGGLPLEITALDGDSVFEGIDTTPGGLYDVNVVNPDENPRMFYVVNIGNVDSPVDANITVTLTDGACVNTTMVFITVVNDTQPYFEFDRYNGSIPEKTEVETVILTVKAYNSDGSNNGLEYYLQSATNGGGEIFEVVRETGEIKVKSENTDADGPVIEYSLFIEAQDRRIQDNIKSASTAVVIQITDINDNPPSFDPSFYQASISEDALPLYPIVTVKATDIDSNAILVYSIINDPTLKFDIDEDTGLITLAKELNRDPPDGVGNYSIQVSVTDGMDNDTCTVDITVLDVNDNPPEFTSDSYDISALENATSASIQVYATDADSGENGLVTFDLLPTERNISVDPQSGIVTFNGPFDREDAAEIVVTVVAMDNGTPTLSTNALVTLTLLDVNDESPEFIQSSCNSIRLSEDTAIGTLVCMVSAVDIDDPASPNSVVSYDVQGPDAAYFSISENDGAGELRLSSTLDWESKTSLQITIQASDNGVPVLSSTLNVTISVDDINDNAPVFSQADYRVTFNEAVPVASPVISVSVQDDDETSVILCNITGGNQQYFFATSDGRQLCTLTSAMPIPEDLSNPYTVTILAYNPDQESLRSPNSEAIVNVFVGAALCFIDVDPEEYAATYKVEDVSNGIPVISIIVNTECNGEIGYNVTSQTLLPDAGDGTIPEPSSNFTVVTNGDIIPTTDDPAVGLHQIIVNVFNASDPTYFPDNAYVYITILPDDNEPPVFGTDLQPDIIYIPKLQGEQVFDLEGKAMDPDSPLIDVGEIYFEEIREIDDDGTVSNILTVMRDGAIILSDNLLDINRASYSVSLSVKVSDNGMPPLNDTAVIVFTIRPPVTSPPVFLPSSCDTIEIPEGPRLTAPLCTVQAESEDPITYSIEDQRFFSVDPSSGNIMQNIDLDYEQPTQREFLLTVVAEANGLQNYTTVNVSVTNINDNAPDFEEGGCFSTIQPPSVVENSAEAFVCSVLAVDADDPLDTVIYSLHGPDSDPFVIDIDGVIRVKPDASLDRESPLDKIYTFNVTATDSGSPSMSTSQSISVVVLDVNDEPPFFMSLEHKVYYDDVQPNTELITVTSDDPDQPPGDIVICEIINGDYSDNFYVTTDGKNCTLISSQQLENARYTVRLVAFNPDQPSLRSQDVQVDVYVGGDYCYVDIEPNEYDTTVLVDDVSIGDIVVDVNATSSCGSEPGAIVYNITSQQVISDVNQSPVTSEDFDINSSSGAISVVSNPPSLGTHTIEVEAYNVSEPDVSRDTAIVVITILPAINTPPMFTNDTLYPEVVIVPQQVNTVVFNLADVAGDGDSPMIGVGEITFEEVSENRDGIDPNLFTVTAEGLVQLTQDLYEFEPAYTVDLMVQVEDKGTPPLSDTAVVKITVEPPTPMFEEPCAVVYYINENQTKAEFICQVKAIGGGEITYTLNDDTYFTIGQSTGEIFTRANAPLDYEEPEQRRILLVVMATAQTGNMISTNVEVLISDVNDEQPEFVLNECIDASVPEDAILTTRVCQVLAVDMDSPDNARITYSLVGDNKDLFDIIADDGYGVISTNAIFNREEQSSYAVTIMAMDNGNPALNSTLDIVIEVEDINDSPPEFMGNPIRVIYNDTIQPGTKITSVAAMDLDEYPNNITLCRLSSPNNSSDLFYVKSDGESCTLFSATQVDLQPTEPYVVVITAYNPDKPTLISDASSIEVRVYVSTNQCFAVIQPGDYTIRKDVTDVVMGEPVTTVRANSSCTDGSEGDTLYNITSQQFSPFPGELLVTSTNFTINTTTGIISSAVDYPATGIHRMRVIAYHTVDPVNSVDEVEVEITLVPDLNTPPSFDQAIYNVTLTSPILTVPITVLDLADSVTDPDIGQIGNGQLSFTQQSIDPDDGLFEVTEAGKINLINILIEEIEAYMVNLNIAVADKGVPPQSDQALVHIYIKLPDTGTQPPRFEPDDCIDLTITEEVEPPIALCQVQASSETGSAITYSLDSEFFQIDPDTGDISSTQKLDYEMPTQRQFRLLVQASSQDGEAFKTIDVNNTDVNDNIPVFDMDVYSFNVIEETNCPGYIGRVHATDEDTNERNIYLEYRLKDPVANIAVDPISGNITTTGCLDRDTDYRDGIIVFDVLAENVNADEKSNASGSVVVTINIADLNDNSPVFSNEKYVARTTPLTKDMFIIQVEASDVDQGANGDVYYLLDDTQDEEIIFEFFKISQDTGEIRTRFTEFPLEPTEYLIRVTAYDKGTPQESSEASVKVIAGNLEEPYFRPGDQVQDLDFPENEAGFCVQFTAPLFNVSLGVMYQIVNDTQEFTVQCRGDEPYLCTSNKGLDRENKTAHSIVILASTGTENCSVSANSVLETTDVTIETNMVMLDVTVLDENDQRPEFEYVANRGRLPNMYFIGVADDAMYNSSVYDIQANDRDLNSTLIYSISQNLLDTCYGTPAFDIDNTGSVIVKDTLYSHLVGPSVELYGQQALFDYTIVVNDTIQHEAVEVKMKILRVYEHIIISLEMPPEEVVQKIDDFMSCLDLISELKYVLFVRDIQAFVMESPENFSLVNPQMTNIWLYAVNTTSLDFAKFWEFKRDFDKYNGKGCFPGYSDINRPRNIFYDDVPYAGYCLLAMAALIGLAAIICICAYFWSVDKMLHERSHMKSNMAIVSIQPQDDTNSMHLNEDGKLNLQYEAVSVYEHEAVSDVVQETKIYEETKESVDLVGSAHSSRLSQHLANSAEDAKIKVVLTTEIQEVSMDFFNETPDDFDFDDMPEPKSPTEAHILVLGDADNEIAETDNKELSSGTPSHTGSDQQEDEGQVEGDQKSLEVKSDDANAEGLDSEDVTGDKKQDGNPQKGLVTFFDEPLFSADDDRANGEASSHDLADDEGLSHPPPPPPPPLASQISNNDNKNNEFPPPPAPIDLVVGDQVEVSVTEDIETDL